MGSEMCIRDSGLLRARVRGARPRALRGAPGFTGVRPLLRPADQRLRGDPPVRVPVGPIHPARVCPSPLHLVTRDTRSRLRDGSPSSAPGSGSKVAGAAGLRALALRAVLPKYAPSSCYGGSGTAAARPERWAARLARAGLPVSCSAATRPDPSGARDGRRQLVSSRRTNPARRSEKPRLAAAQVVLAALVLPATSASLSLIHI